MCVFQVIVKTQQNRPVQSNHSTFNSNTSRHRVLPSQTQDSFQHLATAQLQSEVMSSNMLQQVVRADSKDNERRDRKRVAGEGLVKMSVAGISLSPAHTEVNSSEVRRQGMDGRMLPVGSLIPSRLRHLLDCSPC